MEAEMEAEMEAARFFNTLTKFPNFQSTLRTLSLTKKNTPGHPVIQSRRAEDIKRAFLIKISREIELNYQNPDYKMEQLASALVMSKRQLYRKCAEYSEMKPGEFLREFRLNEAIQLVAKGEPANSVAMSTGFSTHSSFGRSFKIRYGCCPSVYFQELA